MEQITFIRTRPKFFGLVQQLYTDNADLDRATEKPRAILKKWQDSNGKKTSKTMVERALRYMRDIHMSASEASYLRQRSFVFPSWSEYK